MVNRRKFIKNAALSSAGIVIIPRHVLGGGNFVAPSDKVNVGIVGAGGQSMFSIRELAKLNDVQIMSIADPSDYWTNDILYSTDTGRGPVKKYIEGQYANKSPNYKISEYIDFREMLEKEKSLDAIVCASPDNTHAYISITSMRAGKHVYCEKPLTHNIWEARKIRDVAKETGLSTQMGNQLHSTDTIRQTVEYLRAGAIGKVYEAHSWVGATRWLPALSGFPKETSPVPANFNWDLWLGPTSWRQYNKMYTPVKWRDFWEFGCGALGDFGCHDMDAVTWAFNLKEPDSVQVYPAGNRGNSDIAPYGEIGYYHFSAKGEQQPLKLVWYSGGLKPDLPEIVPQNIEFSGRGAMFVGDEGVIITNGGATSAPLIFPETRRNSFKPPVQTIPRSKGHHREWIDGMKGGPAAMSNFDYASRLTELTLLGVLSLRLGGKKIIWDYENMKAEGLPEADSIIREPVRKGWEMK
ncbi:MAG: Gfo/Idh/MocA family oxidoreductase [Prolixibacteraceae bacterium]|nr:Gfo/Idh/MocA family oxidoreductase [Prolixibacteraceae bacterium]